MRVCSGCTGAAAIGSDATLVEVAPVTLPHVTAALKVGGKERALASRNIIATLPGSDYRDFARAGVPFLRFFGNFFPAYHEPADTPDGIDPAQVQRVARFCLATTLLLADQGSSTSAYQPRETMVVP